MKHLVGLTFAVLAATTPSQAPAQTVINLTNQGFSTATGETTLDLVNSSVALSTGGFRGGAISMLGQSANNQLNVLDLLSTSAGMPAASVTPLTGVVQLNMLMGLQPISLTTVNTSGAIASGINSMIGPASLNSPWTGGYGGASGAAMVGGSQSGLNALNGVAIAMAPGSTLSLVQQTGPLALLPLAQMTMLNATISNTWFASSLNGGATINGAAGLLNTGLQAGGNQNGGITVNGAVVVGGGTLYVEQYGVPSFATFQAINRAGAFTNTALTPSFSIR